MSAGPRNLELATMAPMLARLEAQPLAPPENLAGVALAMFQEMAAGNVQRPWNKSHALALADYCRVTAMWTAQLAAIETEGPVIGNKPNARFAALRLLSSERLRLAKLLGLAVGPADSYLGGKLTNASLQRLSASMSRTADADEDGLLS